MSYYPGQGPPGGYPGQAPGYPQPGGAPGYPQPGYGPPGGAPYGQPTVGFAWIEAFIIVNLNAFHAEIYCGLCFKAPIPPMVEFNSQ